MSRGYGTNFSRWASRPRLCLRRRRTARWAALRGKREHAHGGSGRRGERGETESAKGTFGWWRSTGTLPGLLIPSVKRGDDGENSLVWRGTEEQRDTYEVGRRFWHGLWNISAFRTRLSTNVPRPRRLWHLSQFRFERKKFIWSG